MMTLTHVLTVQVGEYDPSAPRWRILPWREFPAQAARRRIASEAREIRSWRFPEVGGLPAYCAMHGCSHHQKGGPDHLPRLVA